MSTAPPPPQESSGQRAGVQGSCSRLTLPTPGPPDVTSIRTAARARRGRGKPVRRLSISAARGSAGPLTWGRRRPHSGGKQRGRKANESAAVIMRCAVRQHHPHEPRAATAYFSPAMRARIDGRRLIAPPPGPFRGTVRNRLLRTSRRRPLSPALSRRGRNNAAARGRRQKAGKDARSTIHRSSSATP